MKGNVNYTLCVSFKYIYIYMCTVSKYENIQLELCLRIYMYIFPNRAMFTHMYVYIYNIYIHMVAQNLRASTNSF